MLAALLGALTSAAAAGPSASFVTAPIVAEHGGDARSTTAKPATVRPEAYDISLNLGGLDDSGTALAARDGEPLLWTSALDLSLPAAFDLPVSAARTRDGRTRAPPVA
ncbi:hypothetical protein [uncultured Hyphomicrobium sp.]|uniref:hypothetical protein n=1 Tax=uncultured Hyphomicrobium sp. TaxID=194373 RepID=UPI0025F1A098|nr:hypothetical protein [uncultured Hyphomicrobium sp.]